MTTMTTMTCPGLRRRRPPFSQRRNSPFSTFSPPTKSRSSSAGRIENRPANGERGRRGHGSGGTMRRKRRGKGKRGKGYKEEENEWQDITVAKALHGQRFPVPQ